MILHPSTIEEFNEIISKGKVLVDFFATWCGPCKMLTPIIEELDSSGELNDVKIVKVDTDDVPYAAMNYGVNSIPTLIYFEDGKEIKRTLGYQSKQKIISFVAK